MYGFYMENYTELKWVKKEYPLPQIFNLVCQNVSEEVFLTDPKIYDRKSLIFQLLPSHYLRICVFLIKSEIMTFVGYKE